MPAENTRKDDKKVTKESVNDYVPIWWVHILSEGEIISCITERKWPRNKTYTPEIKMTEYGFGCYVACDNRTDAKRIAKELYSDYKEGGDTID